MLVSKFMTLQPGKKITTIHPISQWDNVTQYLNETMKFGQLIEYKTRNNLLEIFHPKCGGETSPRPFPKRSKLNNLLINSIKFHSLLLLYVKVEGYQNVLELRCRPLASTSYQAFLKKQKEV